MQPINKFLWPASVCLILALSDVSAEHATVPATPAIPAENNGPGQPATPAIPAIPAQPGGGHESASEGDNAPVLVDGAEEGISDSVDEVSSELVVNAISITVEAAAEVTPSSQPDNTGMAGVERLEARIDSSPATLNAVSLGEAAAVVEQQILPISNETAAQTLDGLSIDVSISPIASMIADTAAANVVNDSVNHLSSGAVGLDAHSDVTIDLGVDALATAAGL